MKIKSFPFLIVAFAAVLAISLWFGPRKSAGHALNVPASDVSLQANHDTPPPAPAAVVAPVFAFNIAPAAGTLLGLLVIAGIAFYVAVYRTRRGRLVSAINTLPQNVGGSDNPRRFRATAAIATPAGAPAICFILVKKGADDEHAAIVAAASDEPIGAATDQAAAAEDLVAVELFGISSRTVPLIAKAAIGLRADVYSDGTGKVTIKPTAAGTYWRVGKAQTAAGADNDPIEVMPCQPKKLVVLAAMTQAAGDIADTPSTAVNPTKADFDSLLVAAGKLQADYNLLVAALATGAEIDFATT